MVRARYVVFDILSYWQAGSGLGEDASADSVVARDDCGLPLLPGRTVKGLLRNAMELACVPTDRIQRWFGSSGATVVDSGQIETDVLLEQSRFKTVGGALHVGSALLPDAWRAWSRDLPEAGEARDAENQDVRRRLEIRAALFRHVASTSIDATGVARDKTLRVAEVAVPMSLRSRVEGPADDTAWVDDIASALPFLRVIGTRRHRGYGRVRCLMEQD